MPLVLYIHSLRHRISRKHTTTYHAFYLSNCLRLISRNCQDEKTATFPDKSRRITELTFSTRSLSTLDHTFPIPKGDSEKASVKLGQMARAAHFGDCALLVATGYARGETSSVASTTQFGCNSAKESLICTTYNIIMYEDDDDEHEFWYGACDTRREALL